jgi:3-oxoacyl-[acyl-carrier protein] reductase
MGITVNAISPGATDSGQGGASSPESSEPKVAVRSIQRIQRPDDLVGLMVLRSSPASDCITGQNIVVDGGGVVR